MANMFKEAAEKTRLSAQVKEPVKEDVSVPIQEETPGISFQHQDRSPSPTVDPTSLGLSSVNEQVSKAISIQKASFPVAPANPRNGIKNSQVITGRAYSIYLDDDVAAAVNQIAAMIGSSRSKTVNQILRNILSN